MVVMAENAIQLVGVGSPVVDLLAKVSEAHIASIDGEKGGMELVDTNTIENMVNSLPETPAIVPGGSAGNTAFAAARLGLKSTFIGKVGHDELGKLYRDRFAETGGDVSRFKVGNVANGRCLSMITPDSERTMRTDLGAAMTLAPDEISTADFAGCQHAHIEGYMLFNRNLMYKVLDSAKAAGCSISVDLASFEVVGATKDVLPEILDKYIDIVFANEEEANAYTGLGDDYEGMAKQLGETSSVAAVKLGKSGSLIHHHGETTRIAPIIAQNAIDTTAAGDFWAAGFLYGWLNGKDIATSGKFGSILGAEVVQTIGSTLSDKQWDKIKLEVRS